MPVIKHKKEYCENKNKKVFQVDFAGEKEGIVCGHGYGLLIMLVEKGKGWNLKERFGKVNEKIEESLKKKKIYIQPKYINNKNVFWFIQAKEIVESKTL